MSDETKVVDAGCEVEQSKYDPNDVTTWTSQEFEQKVRDKLRAQWSKIESIKNLLRDGKQVVAYEQIQGLSDTTGFLVKLFDEQIVNQTTELN